MLEVGRHTGDQRMRQLRGGQFLELLDQEGLEPLFGEPRHHRGTSLVPFQNLGQQILWIEDFDAESSQRRHEHIVFLASS